MNRTFAHFEMTSNIQIEKIKEDGTEVKFTIHKV